MHINNLHILKLQFIGLHKWLLIKLESSFQEFINAIIHSTYMQNKVYPGD
jgi:hypothetical protein